MENKTLKSILVFPYFFQAHWLGNLVASISSFETLITSLNNDWRTTYRSFYILSNIDSENAEYWLPLAKRCNPEFPLEYIQPKAFTIKSPLDSN